MKMATTKCFLAFSPFEDEESQNAQNHYDFTIFVLSVYEKTLSNVVALIGDNCNTNKAFANKMRCGFVGWPVIASILLSKT